MERSSSATLEQMEVTENVNKRYEEVKTLEKNVKETKEEVNKTVDETKEEVTETMDRTKEEIAELWRKLWKLMRK